MASDKEVLDYDYFEVLKTYHFNDKCRLGNDFDGGYVIADVSGYDCYISGGIGPDESFSYDFINKYDVHSYAFDGTIDILPDNFPKEMNFINKNISKENNENTTDLSFLLDKHKDVFLKMDIEGGELEWFSIIESLKIMKIKQMVVEFHDLHHKKNEIIDILQKINNTHYIIHAHGNNHAGCSNLIPDVIELTFLRKDEFSTKPNLNKDSLPSKLDFPNKIGSEDIDLNYEPFRFFDLI